jgi:CheY-like chemotaxis protein
MKILVAEDDPIFRRVLQRVLEEEYEVLAAEHGVQAWELLQQPDAPRLAILDWMMPCMDGLEVCRKVRQNPVTNSFYLLLLTARETGADIVTGFAAGANDYVTKPFDPEELRARVRVGRRVVELQTALATRVCELQEALARVKLLQGLLPICSYCKRIRDDQNYWQQVETYLSQHSEAVFSHGICPECFDKFVRPELQEVGTAADPKKSE